MTDDAEPPRRRQYRNPPVIEAIARVVWTTPAPWTFTTPGQLFECLKDVYDGEPQTTAELSAGLVSSGTDSDDSGGFRVSTGNQRFVFSNYDSSRRLAISPRDLSVHGMPPYEGWEALTTRLQDALTMVNSVVDTNREVAHVGLRYVNRIVLPEVGVDIADYLSVSIGFPVGFPEILTGFLERCDMKYSDDTTLSFTWASTEAPTGSSAFILDLDLTSPRTNATVEQAFTVLSEMKLKEGQAFEGLLTDRLRDQFEEVEADG